jgi:DNA-directed RNA polymerase subunit RPC12/RpoP
MKKKKQRRRVQKQAIYKCAGCDRIYSAKSGLQPDCLQCGSQYFTWVNYAEFDLGM